MYVRTAIYKILGSVGWCPCHNTAVSSEAWAKLRADLWIVACQKNDARLEMYVMQKARTSLRWSEHIDINIIMKSDRLVATLI